MPTPLGSTGGIVGASEAPRILGITTGGHLLSTLPISASTNGPLPIHPTQSSKRTYQRFLGIDPGAGGGLVSLFLSGQVADARKIPSTLEVLWAWILSQSQDSTRPGHPLDVAAVLEEVGGYISSSGGEAQEGQPGSSMFNFGEGVGALKAFLVAAGIKPRDTVRPQTWQRVMGIPPRGHGEAKTPWKNRLKAKAQSLFPEIKVTLALADALLLAEFCRRTRGGVGPRKLDRSGEKDTQ